MKNGILKQSYLCYFAIAKNTPGIHWWTAWQLLLLILIRVATAALAYSLSVFVNNKVEVGLFGSAAIGVVSFFFISKFLEWIIGAIHGRIHSYVILPSGLNFIDSTIFKMLKHYEELKGDKSPMEMASILNKKNESKNFLGFLFNHILGPVIELIVCAALLANLGFTWLGWLLIPVCLVHLFISMFIIPKVKDKLTQLLSISAKTVSTFSSSLEKANLAQVFGTTDLLVSHLKEITEKETKELRKLYVLNDAMAVLVNLPLAIFACLFFYFGSTLVNSGVATLGGFAALMGVVATTFSQLKNLSFAFDGLNASLVALNPHLDIQILDDSQKPSKIRIKEAPLLVFKDYRAQIAGKSLFNVSLELLPGQKLYIVGESGTGKTSFIKGMLGYQKCEGKILVNGQEVSDFEKLFSWMPQDTAALEGSVELNLRIGKAEATEQEMLSVLDKVKLLNRVNELGGLKSNLAYQGNNFSGGENQRLSLARALLSENPIMLLDEPSSALDLTLEKEIFSHIEACDKSALIVVHRLKAIPVNGLVLFLQKDKPFEIGTLKDLLKNSRSFSKFYNVDSDE